MARSRKKTPITGWTSCHSEKPDKREWHRRWRSRDRQRLHIQGEDYQPLDHREVSDPFFMGKDGKVYWGEDRPELKRK